MDCVMCQGMYMPSSQLKAHYLSIFGMDAYIYCTCIIGWCCKGVEY